MGNQISLMLRHSFILLILFVSNVCLSQTASLKGKHFKVAKAARFNDSCDFDLEGDCGVQDLNFHDGQVFTWVNECYDNSVSYGNYVVENDKVWLYFSSTLLLQLETEELVNAKYQSGWKYQEKEIERDTVLFTISKCNNRLKLAGKFYYNVVGIALKSFNPSAKYNEQLQNLISMARSYALQEIDLLKLPWGYDKQSEEEFAAAYLERLYSIPWAIEVDNDTTDVGKLINYSPNEFWNEAIVLHSPDSVFKVFSFSGDGCGAHCSGVYETIIQFKKSKKLSRIYEGEVESILQLNDTSYLFISKAWAGGTTGGGSKGLSAYTISNDSLIPFNFAKICTDTNNVLSTYYNHKWDDFNQFGVWSYWYQDEPQLTVTKIDKNSFSIEFQNGLEFYSEDLSYKKFIPDSVLEKCETQDHLLYVKGSFLISNGKMTDFSETYFTKPQ